jgi:uncharacterized SAM-binding protein YcdF (DUF218 family)
MVKLAVVCQAYGTDPTGKLPSKMDLDVVAKAAKLSTWRGIEFVIFQGGYAYLGGPPEAHLMSEAYRKMNPSPFPQIVEECESLNTLYGARAVREITLENGITGLRVIGEDFHIKRIRSTYQGVFRHSGVSLQFYGVKTPFGPNSQKRLRSAWKWWPWEILTRIATPVLIILHK